jgi:hypothetical protein
MTSMGQKIISYKILFVKSEGERLPEQPRCRWENNVKVHLKELEWEYVEWNNLS